MEKEELEQRVNEKEEEEATGVKKKKKGAWKYVLNISVVLIATALSIYFALKDNFNDVVNLLKTSDIKYILLVFGLMFLATCIRAFILYCFARLFTRRYRLHRAFAVDQVGVFYNAVTPGATGGQIMQAYTYKKQGVPISASISILAMYSIVYQIVLILFGLTSFIFKYDFISSLGRIGPITFMEVSFYLPIWPLTIIGFILNLSVIMLVLLMGYWHGFHNFIMGPVVSFLAKIKVCKKPDKTRESLRIQVENFKMEFTRLLTNIPFFILVSLCFFVYLCIKFSIPFFCGMAIDPSIQFSWKNFWDSIFLCNYHQMVTGLIPLPGSAGASELFFSQLFSSYFSSGQVTRACLLMWRSLTFTIPLIIAGFVAAFYRSSPKKEIENEERFPDRQTMVALQNETYTARMEELNSTISTGVLSKDAVKKLLSSAKITEEKKPPEQKKDDE